MTGLIDEARDELEQLIAGTPVVVELDPLEAWAVLSHIQLALRHPDNNGALSRAGRDAGKRLQDALGERLGPVLHELAEMGWDPQWDV